MKSVIVLEVHESLNKKIFQCNLTYREQNLKNFQTGVLNQYIFDTATIIFNKKFTEYQMYLQ